MLKNKEPLFFQDEDLDTMYSVNGLVRFDFEGTPLEVSEQIKSIIFLSYEGLFVQAIKTATRKVLLSQIVWTDHPSYQSLWDIKEKKLFDLKFHGNRDPGEEGVNSGWMPRKGKGDPYIKLCKHPDVNEYVITGDGNNRIMKSLTTKDSVPYVYAKVSLCEWLSSTQNLLAFLAEYSMYSVHVKICNHHRFHQRFPQIYIGIRQYSDSKKFYLVSEWSNSLALNEEINKHENILKQKIASWTHISRWEKIKVYLSLLY